MNYRLITDGAKARIVDASSQEVVESVDLGVPPTTDTWRALADHALIKSGWERIGEWNGSEEGSTSVDRLTPAPEEILEVGRYVKFRTSNGVAHGRITKDERSRFGQLTVQVNDVNEHRSISPWCVLGETAPPKLAGTVTCAAPGCGRKISRRAQVPTTSLGDRVCNQDCWDRAEAAM